MERYSDRNVIYDTTSSLVVEYEAIFQSIWNLIQTEVGSRLFNNVGVSLKYYLKKKCNQSTALAMKQYLGTVFAAEPRVKFDSVNSSIIPVPQQRLFLVHLVFIILGITEGETKKSLDLVLYTEGAK